MQRGGEGAGRSGSLLSWLCPTSPLQPKVQPLERTIRSPTELFQTPTHCKEWWELACVCVWGGELNPYSLLVVFLIPQTSSLLPSLPSSPAGWLPPELLALWTHCAQPPLGALRRRPPPEPEEEERRMETPSDIEVTAHPGDGCPQGRPPLEFQQAAFWAPPTPQASGARSYPQVQASVTLPGCLCDTWGLSSLSPIPRS